MFRKLIIVLMSMSLAWTTLACGAPSISESPSQAPRASQQRNLEQSEAQAPLPNGEYGVQQASFNDVDGEYNLFLLNTQPGTPSSYRVRDLQMAQLSPEEVSAGKKAYLKVNQGQASLHIPEDFRIEYVHNVTENQTDPQTGETQTVVVNQRSSFWTPFAGALAGQAIGSLLFTPRYYVPPIYQPGIMRGYGGYGTTYGQAVNRYQARYQSPPAVERNRTVFRSTGQSARRSNSPSTTSRRGRSSSSANRSTGTGYGSSNLRQNQRSNPSQYNRRSPSNFGSGRSRSTGFGSGRSRSTGRRR